MTSPEEAWGRAAPTMSDRTNLILGGLIVGLIALDLAVLRSGATVFLAKKLLNLVDYLVFWR